MFIPSQAYYHNSDITQDICQLIGYHDNQSGTAPPDALYPVAQYRPAVHTWEYWESVWDDREWWEDSTAVQTWMDVESILSARGVHRKRPSICWQGNVSEHTVCRLITGGLVGEVLSDVIGWGQMGCQKCGLLHVQVTQDMRRAHARTSWSLSSV